MSYTHQLGIIDLLLAWIHWLIDFSLLFFFIISIISLLSPLFHLVSPCFFHFLFIIIIRAPLHHRYSSSSSSVFLFIVIGIPLHHHHCSHRYFFSVFFLLFHPLFIHLLILKDTLLVRCLQGEQSIYQKSHFLCAIVKFA